ncbi:MAG: L,D-transpeptidase family protein [Gammaproteobacteria bacterium]|nr:L,D-transpeptidase family protein [Gammaproteobacteria bacterium]
MLKFLAALFLLSITASLVAEPVPAWLLRLPESTTTVFIAETSTSSFHRFDRTAHGVQEIREDDMSIGQAGTGKQHAGDRRTPLGIYFVTEQLDTSRLHEKYGATAFPLDYPNAWDRRQGRSGDGIWVHGVDANGGVRPPLDTDGCIALPNEQLLELEPFFEPNTTPVLISREIDWVEAEQAAAIRDALESAVAEWAVSLEKGDMFSWLDLYDEAFEHWGMNKAEWSAFSLETFGERAITAVTVSDLLLLGDPVEDGLYLSRFRLEISEGDARKVIAVRRMYWRRSESGAYKIIAEDSG